MMSTSVSPSNLYVLTDVGGDDDRYSLCGSGVFQLRLCKPVRRSGRKVRIIDIPGGLAGIAPSQPPGLTEIDRQRSLSVGAGPCDIGRPERGCKNLSQLLAIVGAGVSFRKYGDRLDHTPSSRFSDVSRISAPCVLECSRIAGHADRHPARSRDKIGPKWTKSGQPREQQQGWPLALIPAEQSSNL